MEVLARAALDDHPGIYNVAGPGILYLSQAVRRAGKPSVPVATPLANGLADLVRRTGRLDFPPEQLQFLLYGRVGDIGRLRERFGYEPKFSSRAAFDDFVASRQVTGPIDAQTVARWERRIYDLLTPRRDPTDVWTHG